jgi:hypothetical protein
MNVHEECDVNSHAHIYLDDCVSLNNKGGQGDPMKSTGDVAFTFATPASGSKVEP